MLGDMRDRSGAPTGLMRALALLLALLLTGPLALLVLRVLAQLVDRTL